MLLQPKQQLPSPLCMPAACQACAPSRCLLLRRPPLCRLSPDGELLAPVLSVFQSPAGPYLVECCVWVQNISQIVFADA